MNFSPVGAASDERRAVRIFGKGRVTLLMTLGAVLLACLAYSVVTQGVVAHLGFLHGNAYVLTSGGIKQPLVDLRPWQTAQNLAPLAVSAEEQEFAHDAERLADHEVDQAFAAALRQARLMAAHKVLTGDALTLSQKVQQLEQLVKEDQGQVNSLTVSPAGASKGQPAAPAENDDLDVAKAQLGLDSDELADAQQDLQRASGDQTAQIQAELAAHEAAMAKYDAQTKAGAQVAVISVGGRRTLAGLVKAWFDQFQRRRLLQQAGADAQAKAASVSTEHNALEQTATQDAAALHAHAGNAQDRTRNVADLKNLSAQRQILSIDDDRMQTEQQLAKTYARWDAQVALQHQIVLHLIIGSLGWIALILIGTVLCDALAERLLMRGKMDPRQLHTLRTIVRLSLQVFGGLLILLVVFGVPQQTPTVLGLATAALTIALQDYILAFFGWFILMGKNGVRVGDWVEINGVGGEAVEIGLISTTLLETGGLAGQGYPTGRRISFLNSFAIKGQYFNFSTAGQWMWDEITVNVPAAEDLSAMVEQFHEAAEKETGKNTRLAESEWKNVTRGESLSRFSGAPMVNLRPNGTGTDVQVRYITRASERFELRNRLYREAVELLQKKNAQPEPAQ